MSNFTEPWSNDFPDKNISDWRALVDDGSPEALRALQTEIEPGLRCEPLYGPGEAVGPSMGQRRREPGWVVAQQYDSCDAQEVAEAVRVDAVRGLQSAWVRLDAGLRGGAKPRGVVRPGVRLVTEDDAAALLEATVGQGIALWIEAGAAGPVIADLIDRTAKRKGIDRRTLRGGVLCDPLGTLAENGCLRADLATALDDLVRVTSWGHRDAPSLATVEASAVSHHDAGATAAQELAVVLSTGLVYLRALDDAGVRVADALPRFVLRFAVGSDLFLEIAKLRAARWLWTRVAQRCGVDAPGVWLSVRTAWRNRTRHDPWVNQLRGTVESFAAVVGGADEVATQPLTDGVAPGNTAARRWAIATQHLLREESHVGHPRDPGGGSGYLEAMTRDLAEQAWALVRRIEATGGMAEALLLGEVEGWIAEASESRRSDVATGRAPLVGTTLYPDPEERPPEPAPRADHEEVPRSARLEAPPLPIARLAEPFETLREASRAYRERTGSEPTAALLAIGGEKQARAQLERAESVMVLGGFRTRKVEAHAAGSEVARARTRVVVLCGPDDAVAKDGPALTRRLLEAGATHVVVAGASGEDAREALRKAGAYAIMKSEVDVPELMSALQQAMGVRS